VTSVNLLAVALPDNSEYVAAAYLVFLVLLLIYLSIMATKLSKLERDTAELAALADRKDDPAAAPQEPASAAVPAEGPGAP